MSHKLPMPPTSLPKPPSLSPVTNTKPDSSSFRLPTPPGNAAEASVRSALPKPPSASGLPQPPATAARLQLPGVSALPQPPQAAALQRPPTPSSSMQNTDLEISNLREKLESRELQVEGLTAYQKSLKSGMAKLKADLEQHQEAHKAKLDTRDRQHQADLASQQKNMISRQEAEKTIEDWQEHANIVKEQLAQAQAQLQSNPAVPDAAARAELDSTKAVLDEVRAELATAQQTIAKLQDIKTEDGEAERRAIEAESRITRLEADLKARDTELANAKQTVQDAQKQYQDARQALDTKQSELQSSQQQQEELQHKCDEQKEGFAKACKSMFATTEDHAAQYSKDRNDLERQIKELQSDSRHGHKRSRDSSNGRDSRRRP